MAQPTPSPSPPPPDGKSRVIDYFIVVGCGSTLRAIDDAPAPRDDDGGTSLLPPPPRTYMDRLYRGSVLTRFPSVDHESVPLPDGIAMFCIPDSIRLTHSKVELPVLYYFAATQGNGSRLYGACLKFYEAVPSEAIAALEEQDRLAQQRLHAISAAAAAPSTTLSAGRESNPLSRTEAEHSLSSTQRDRGRSDVSVTHKQRSPSPSTTVAHGAASTAASSSSIAPPMPPRPARGHITLDSFAPILQLATPSPSPQPPTVSPPAASASPAKPRTVYAPKCLCIISLHPFLEQYRVWLTELYRISLTPTVIPIERYISNFTLEVPLPPLGELKYQYAISNQLIEFARNPPNNPLLMRSIHSSAANRASRILTLFELLDLENIIVIMECILLEKRLLFLSSKLSLLALVTEILLHLMLPFSWPHVYVPLLPRALIDFLCAPMPFIIGMHHSYVKGHLQGEVLVDLVIIDLDKNKITFSDSVDQVSPPSRASFSSSASSPDSCVPPLSHHFLPSRERKKLKLKLKPFQALFSRNSTITTRPPHQAFQLRVLDELDLAFPSCAQPDELESIEQYATLLADLSQQESDIPLAFFRCFVSLFKDYRECLIHPSPSNPNPDPCFKLAEFLKKSGAPSESVGFYTAFANTQAFQRFCEERIYPPPPPAAGASSSGSGPLSKELASFYSIQFFDESISAKRNRSIFLTKRIPTPFLDDTKFELKSTVRIPPPESVNLPPPVDIFTTSPAGVVTKRVKPFTYSYETWPDILDETLLWGERLQPPSKQQRHVRQLSPHRLERKLSLGNATNLVASAAASCALSTVADSTDPVAVLEEVWFIVVSSMAAAFHSAPLLKLGLGLLEQRVQRVVAARAASGAAWRLMDDLPSPPSEDVFLRLMSACGACSLPELATNVFQTLMLSLAEYAVLEDRSAPQTVQMYSFLLTLHSMNNDHRGLEGLSKLKRITSRSANATPTQTTTPTTDRSPYKLPPITTEEQVEQTVTSPIAPGTPSSAAVLTMASLDQGADDSDNVGMPEDSVSSLPSSLLSFDKAQFERVFPGYTVEMPQACPECRKPMTDGDVRAGWTMKESDATTACPSCHARFVAHFTVRPVDPTSSESPVVCDYWSPLVLRKEITRLVDANGVGDLAEASFQQTSPTLFYCLTWSLSCIHLRVPLDVLGDKHSTGETSPPEQSKPPAAITIAEEDTPLTVTVSSPSAAVSSPLDSAAAAGNIEASDTGIDLSMSVSLAPTDSDADDTDCEDSPVASRNGATQKELMSATPDHLAVPQRANGVTTVAAGASSPTDVPATVAAPADATEDDQTTGSQAEEFIDSSPEDTDDD